MNVVGVSYQPYRLELAGSLPGVHGALTHREGIVLRLRDDDGHEGFGEICSWPGFGSQDSETLGLAVEALLKAPEAVCGFIPDSPEQISSWVHGGAWPVELAAGLECAFLDLLAKRLGSSLAELLTEQPEASVAVHVLAGVGSARPDDTVSMENVPAIKIKASADVGETCARVRLLRQSVPSTVPFRIDANGAWDWERACRAVELLAPFNIEFIEQPFAPGNTEHFVRFRNNSEIAVAADESLSDVEAFDELLGAQAIDVAVVKPTFLGGPYRSMQLIRRAKRARVECVVTHALGSIVERSAALHVALAGGGARACGLGHPFVRDLDTPYPVAGARARARSLPGHGALAKLEQE